MELTSWLCPHSAWFLNVMQRRTRKWYIREVIDTANRAGERAFSASLHSVGIIHSWIIHSANWYCSRNASIYGIPIPGLFARFGSQPSWPKSFHSYVSSSAYSRYLQCSAWSVCLWSVHTSDRNHIYTLNSAIWQSVHLCLLSLECVDTSHVSNGISVEIRNLLYWWRC